MDSELLGQRVVCCNSSLPMAFCDNYLRASDISAATEAKLPSSHHGPSNWTLGHNGNVNIRSTLYPWGDAGLAPVVKLPGGAML